ncbi:upstream activation factor subunit spp27 [Oryza sativa Japonica Group]|uniref:upstream activation factor subunit spp27 n=1 Tax=Oryza sativa subsp. japonica TaxID=39947 RepID=UPI0000681011|nr:upstream activation factor subunit spp27 [Oryza sativa Japonica Group]
MSATATAAAIRSGELLACPMALRRAAAPVAAAMSFRMGRAATARAGRLATRVRVRVVAAAEEGAAEGKSSGKKKRAASGIMKPKPISAELREFVGGAEELPRTEALKIIWAHIKGNNLQDPNNKKIIVCDEKLKKIFGGRDRVGFLEISGLLNPHFQK